MRVPRRPSRFVLVTAVIVVCLAAGAIGVKLAYYPSPIDGVCRSLGPGHDFEPVPGDVLEKAAQTSDVALVGYVRDPLAAVCSAINDAQATFGPRYHEFRTELVSLVEAH